jgi:salicylate hydroxylase
VATQNLPPAHLPRDTTFWVGPGGHIATYYIRHGALVNVVAVRETAIWLEESWSVEGDVEELRAAFPDVHDKLRVLLEQAEQCFKWGLFDRDPLPTWTKRRVTLLGDAAHPMLPFLGQGVAMAIEDAYVLARELARSPHNVDSALRAYEAERVPRTAQVQLASRERGRILHKTSHWEPTESATLNIDWLYHYDPTCERMG